MNRSSQPTIDVDAVATQLDPIVAPLIDGHWIEGTVIGLIAGDRDVIRAYGHARDGGPPPDEHTLFEIGSVTKSFTALLLADMLERREVATDTTVQSLLPAGVTIASGPDRPILLVDLATHFSGLTRLPEPFHPANVMDPYIDVHEREFLEAVARARLTATPGTHYEYSNFGYALLGYALSRRAHTTYAELLTDRVLSPLGLADTTLDLDASQRTRLAAPHDGDGDPAHEWNHDTMAPAGALHSNVRDMIRFVRAQIDPPDSLAGAITRSHVLRHETSEPPGHVTFGWHTRRDGHTLWHNGQTGGFHSFVAFDVRRGIGVVVLANSASPHVDAIGLNAMRLLHGANAVPIALPRTAAIDDSQLARLAGTFVLGPGIPLVIIHEPGVLRVRLADQPAVRIHPSSATEFYLRVVEASLTFEIGADGRASAVTLHQNGIDQRAVRAP